MTRVAELAGAELDALVARALGADPTKLAAANEEKCGLPLAMNVGDGSKMVDVHREAFQECIGMSYTEFEAAWAKWVEETYVVNPAKE